MLESPVVFLHGNVGTGSDWAPVVSALDDGGARGRFSTPTLWDYFSQSPGSPNFDDWVEWFCESNHVGGDKPVMVGYSLGGRLALHALVKYPELFQGAVIVCANTGLDPVERAERLKIDRDWRTKVIDDLDGFLNDWESQLIFAEGAAMPERKELVVWQDEIAAAFDVWSLGRQENLLSHLSSITCPVLWVSGQRDVRFTRIAAAAAAATQIGEHVIVADAGHRVPWDQPAETARLISESLRKMV